MFKDRSRLGQTKLDVGMIYYNDYCLLLISSMVLSRAAVMSYIKSVHRCPSNDAADDMFLGSMAGALHWDIVHTPLFHQV